MKEIHSHLGLACLIWLHFHLLPISEEAKDTIGLSQYAYNFQIAGEADSAIVYYEKALEKTKDRSVRQSILINLSILHKNRGNYDKALDYGIEGLKLMSNPSKAKASCLNTIANIYYHTKDNYKALEYHYHALNIRKAINHPKGVAMSYNNIGNVYTELLQYDSAIFNYEQALGIKKQLGDQVEIASTLHNLGWAYLKQEDFETSENYLLNSLRIKESLQDSVGYAHTTNLLGRLYIKNGQLPKAEKYLNLTTGLATRHKLLDISRQNLFDQSEYFKLLGDHKKQAELLLQYIAINDSLLNRDKARALSEMQVKYDAEKKDQEISFLQEVEKLQQTKISEQQLIVWVISGAAFILFVFLVIIFVQSLNNRKKRMLIEQLNQEMQHRIKNNLQVLSGILKLQSSKLHDSQAVRVLKTGEGRVNAMALIHQLLFANKEKRAINAKKYVKELCEYLSHSFFEEGNAASIDQEVEDLPVDVDRMVSVGLIINELVTNAMKHAFTDGSDLVIRISFRKLETGNLFLEIRDNGSGIDEDHLHEDRQSFGLQLIRMLAKQLNAEINIFNKEGAVFQFSIP